MARPHRTPPPAHLEEAITVLFCLLVDEYPASSWLATTSQTAYSFLASRT